MLLQVGGNGLQLARLGGEAALLHTLQPAGLVRDPHGAVQGGADMASAVGVLVQVHHLPAGGGRVGVLQQLHSDHTGGLGVQGEDRGLDFHSGGDAQYRQGLPYGLADIPGGPVPAGKEQQPRPRLPDGPGGVLGVLGRSVSGAGVDHLAGQAQGLAQVLPHGAGGGEDHHPLPAGEQRAQGPGRLLLGLGPGPSGLGGGQGLSPVRPLQGHLAPHAGDGIDNQAESLRRPHAVSCRPARSRPAGCNPGYGRSPAWRWGRCRGR